MFQKVHCCCFLNQFGFASATLHRTAQMSLLGCCYLQLKWVFSRGNLQFFYHRMHVSYLPGCYSHHKVRVLPWKSAIYNDNNAHFILLCGYLHHEMCVFRRDQQFYLRKCGQIHGKTRIYSWNLRFDIIKCKFLGDVDIYVIKAVRTGAKLQLYSASYAFCFRDVAIYVKTCIYMDTCDFKP